MTPDQPSPTIRLIACKVCGQVHELEPLEPGTIAICRRCGSRIRQRTHGRAHLTAAFALAALLLYLPANIFPILRLDLYGATQENTVWEGCVRFWESHDYVIAIIVFLASILIPALKLLSLFVLTVSTRFRFKGLRKTRTRIYQAVESLGRWAMLDVFVMAIIVSLVRLQKLATIIPGKGLLAFTLVVMFTLFASAAFDPELIWEDEETIA